MPGVKGMRGSGGARVGAGRKPKGATLLHLHGGRTRVSRPQPDEPASSGPVAPIAPPADLPVDQLAVWTLLAPHALTARTLTPGTVGSFVDLCRAVVLRDRLFAVIEEEGWTFTITVRGDTVFKKHPLVADQRGWEQRVEAGRARFKLAPIGKAITLEEPAKPKSALERLQDQAQQMKRVK